MGNTVIIRILPLLLRSPLTAHRLPLTAGRAFQPIILMRFVTTAAE
jgi:hypothetical protein